MPAKENHAGSNESTETDAQATKPSAGKCHRAFTFLYTQRVSPMSLVSDLSRSANKPLPDGIDTSGILHKDTGCGSPALQIWDVTAVDAGRS